MDITPLPVRIRPKSLDAFVGQEQILGKGKMLRRLIEADKLTSAIFYGPPGTGKTTLAEIIANTTSADFIQLNAVTAGVKDIREVTSKAKKNLEQCNKRTVLFIDEIHRFNKSQQDALLPDVENGVIVLIGATTENPYFEVNRPLLSRSKVFKLDPLTKKQIEEIMKRTISDKENGLGGEGLDIEDEAFEFLADAAGGDARIPLSALELAALTTPKENGVKRITLEAAEQCIQKRQISYDKKGDNHYDVASAFIKSIRGSDVNAALHWLARMIEAGEDPKFICRRLIIAASEDIGLANSNALNVAVSASRAVEFIGFPEARIPLAHAVIYLTRSPKSNSAYKAIDAAIADVRNKDIGTVPLHLRDAHYKDAKKLGHGKGYLYPHDYEGGCVKQQYLPDKLKEVKYYKPSGYGKDR